ncbi:hypothetical protein LSM04_009449 [Trypanosoma melophagium]|uniref:uncharacterized protein n=1 Tax=Trypanosoma melophagium TaxID=715481 RepID=UPI00351A1C29|nr:hypothetical protein LSM04_009449 [Trypanosoma melophagium]
MLAVPRFPRTTRAKRMPIAERPRPGDATHLKKPRRPVNKIRASLDPDSGAAIRFPDPQLLGKVVTVFCAFALAPLVRRLKGIHEKQKNTYYVSTMWKFKMPRTPIKRRIRLYVADADVGHLAIFHLERDYCSRQPLGYRSANAPRLLPKSEWQIFWSL